MRSPRRGRVDPGRGFGDETVGVMRSGMDARTASAFDIILEPDEILAAWTRR